MGMHMIRDRRESPELEWEQSGLMSTDTVIRSAFAGRPGTANYMKSPSRLAGQSHFHCEVFTVKISLRSNSFASRHGLALDNTEDLPPPQESKILFRTVDALRKELQNDANGSGLFDRGTNEGRSNRIDDDRTEALLRGVVQAHRRTLGEAGCRQLGFYEIPPHVVLSVVIPIYNEERTLRNLVDRVCAVPIRRS